MKIAIVGSGVSGLIAAYLLNPIHDVIVLEAESWIGGHTHTVPVKFEEALHWVDTGFIVFNDRNYPNLNKLFVKLELKAQNSSMSFSVSCEKTGLIYQGSSFDGFFAQRKNLFNPSFYKFFYEIRKFKEISLQYLSEKNPSDENLKEFLLKNKFSDFFVEKYLIPMLSAIWSNPKERILETQTFFLMRFLNNHGMLSIGDRPVWKTLFGGSHTYVKKIIEDFKSKIHVNHSVKNIREAEDGVWVHFNDAKGEAQEIKVDKVILAVHSNQAMRLLAEPGDLIKKTVGEISYQNNEVVLHYDSRCLPSMTRARASWNYMISKKELDKPIVTYDMNRLQNIVSKKPLLVSLNSGEYINPEKVIQKFIYAHPIFNRNVVDIQKQFHTVNVSENKVLFCGAYWGNGFHEDGLNSGIEVAKLLGAQW